MTRTIVLVEKKPVGEGLKKLKIPQPQEFMFKCTQPVYDKKNNTWRRCGKCEYCKKIKTREWQLRCRHELMTNGKAVFFTLTYKNSPIELQPNDCTLFIKRLRKHFDKFNKKLKYIYCGEYGPRTLRPHYHFIVFGLKANELTKKLLTKLWGKGHVDISQDEIDDKAIAYVLGYVRKKQGYDYSQFKQKPFKRQSQGIGKEFCEKRMNEWTKTFYFNLNGYKQPIPRYYQQQAYKKEGKIIRRITPIEKWENGKCKITKQYYYQIIKNVKGTYTNRILKNQINAMYERWKNGKEIFKNIEDWKELQWKGEIFNQWRKSQITQKMLNENYKKSQDIWLPNRIWKEKISKPKTETYYNEKLKISAETYEWLQITSPYGFRDKIDLQI